MRHRTARNTSRTTWIAVFSVTALLSAASWLASSAAAYRYGVDFRVVAHWASAARAQLSALGESLYDQPGALAVSLALLAGTPAVFVIARRRSKRPLAARVRRVGRRATLAVAAKRLALAQDAVRQVLQSVPADDLSGSKFPQSISRRSGSR
jgi:hypothetical protein